MIRRVAMNNRIISIGIMCLLVFGGFVGFVNFKSENVQGATFVSGIQFDGAGGPWTLGDIPFCTKVGILSRFHSSNPILTWIKF